MQKCKGRLGRAGRHHTSVYSISLTNRILSASLTKAAAPGNGAYDTAREDDSDEEKEEMEKEEETGLSLTVGSALASPPTSDDFAGVCEGLGEGR